MENNTSVLSLDDLFIEGRIAEALELRLETIENYARHYRQDVEASKVSSAALLMAGLALSANPLIAVMAGCGALGYGYSLYKDFRTTGRFYPLPLMRKTTADLLTGVGLAASKQDQETDDPLVNVIAYIEPELGHEYELLMVAESQIASYLAKLPPASRRNAYRHMLRHTRLRNSLKLPTLQEVTAAIAFGTAQGKSHQVDPKVVQPLAPEPETEPAIDVVANPVEETPEPEKDVAPQTASDKPSELTASPPPFSQPTYEAHTSPAPTSRNDLTSEQAGLEVLDALASTRRSTLLIGDTGAGKSVTQAYILTKLFFLHPNAEVFVLSQKADSFCGLAQKRRVILFDPTEPEQALFLIHSIWIVYDHRRRLPESQRTGLPPVRLILADWLSINQALEELNREEPVKSSKYLTKLADIIYNGRELNVCLLVDLQSYNLAAVGLKADRNSRKNFNLIGLGNYSIDELGMVNESYGVLTNLISDRYIVASESERSTLNATFRQLQPISKAHQRPIIFSGLSPARLALLPDLRRYKSSQVAAAKEPVTTVEPTTEGKPKQEASALNESASDLKVSDVLVANLGEPLKTIWVFAKKKGNWITAKDVYNNGFSILKGKGVKQIRQYFGLLADTGYGEIDEMDGDKPKSDSAVGFRACSPRSRL
jgi:hypothetical protein